MAAGTWLSQLHDRSSEVYERFHHVAARNQSKGRLMNKIFTISHARLLPARKCKARRFRPCTFSWESPWFLRRTPLKSKNLDSPYLCLNGTWYSGPNLVPSAKSCLYSLKEAEDDSISCDHQFGIIFISRWRLTYVGHWKKLIVCWTCRSLKGLQVAIVLPISDHGSHLDLNRPNTWWSGGPL